MKKIGSILMVMFTVLVVGLLAGCGTTPSPTSPEMVRFESPLYII